jgi:DNA-binding winged helix-turn-helix (wHTH) protein
MRYEFDSCVLDTETQQLWRDGELVHVEPQVLAVLEYLAEHSDRVVAKIELLDEVWGDRFVSESALTSRIKLARRACGDTGRAQRILKTVHSRGYRLVAEVTAGGTRADDGPATNRTALPRTTVAPVVQSRGAGVVGRDAELARLDEIFAEVAGGGRRAVFVCGGIGSGKSTLVAEFLERQDGLDGWLVARGQCIQTRGAVEPYYCLFDALTRCCRAAPELVQQTLDQVAPSWLAQMPSLVEADMVESLERRLLGSAANRMLREGADALEELARRQPLVLVLEDLQWADDLTLDVLEVLLQRTDPVPLMLVGTARGDDASLSGVAMAATGRVEQIDLGPLDSAAVAVLVGERLGVAAVPDELVRIICERCDGIPLFAEEMVSAWVRQEQVTATGGHVSLTAPVAELEQTVPRTLPGLIDRELAGLGADDLTLLEACGAAGESFAAATVAAALDRSVADVETALSAISRRQGVVGATGASSWPDGTVSASYAFTHRLYQQVLDGRILASRRAELHERIGRRIEEGYGDRTAEVAAELAAHFAHTADRLRTIEYLREAGDQAAARNAHHHAADFFADALARLDEVEPGVRRDKAELRLRMSLGPTLVADRGWFDDSISANYERALELCGPNDRSSSAAARYGLATVSELRGEFERTEALLSPLLDTEHDGSLVVEAHELIACSTFHQGAFDRSLVNATMVLDSLDEDAYSVPMSRIAEHPASSCNSWSSLASWALGHSDVSLEQAERAVLLGERNLYALSTAVQQRAMLHQIRNEPDSCMEWADRCREVGEDQDFPMRVIQADIYKGWALGVSGSAEQGEGLIADGLARFRDAGATLNEAYYLGLYADVELHADQPAHALELIDEALDRMDRSTRSYFYESELHRLRARALLGIGDGGLEAAREALDISQAVAERQGSPPLTLRAVTDRLAMEIAGGDPEPWGALIEDLLAVYDAQEPTPDTLKARLLLAA